MSDQTTLPALQEMPLSRAVTTVVEEHGCPVRDALLLLGLDPSMSVARLRADLAIARRARLAQARQPSEAYDDGWNDCRKPILGDDAEYERRLSRLIDSATDATRTNKHGNVIDYGPQFDEDDA